MWLRNRLGTEKKTFDFALLDKPHRPGHANRFLRIEPLEDRRLLAAGIEITHADHMYTKEDGTPATFGVALTEAPTHDVTVAITSSDTTEGTVSHDELVFTSADYATEQLVTVTGVDDADPDGQVEYSVLLTATSDDHDYLGEDAQMLLINVDNDAPGVAVVPTGGLVTTEDGGTDTFQVFLTTEPEEDVTIGLSSDNAAEGTVDPASLTFTSTDWATPQTVTITGVDEEGTADDPDLQDGYVQYSIVTAAAVSDDAAYSGVDGADATVYNADNDTKPGVTVTPNYDDPSRPDLTTTESGGRDRFYVVLDTKPAADVTITLSGGDGVVELFVSELVFTPSDWGELREVDVKGLDDGNDVDQSGYTPFEITVHKPSSSDSDYSSLDAVVLQGLNTDNDQAAHEVKIFKNGFTWWAMKSQRDLAIDESLSNVTHLSTHNSFNAVNAGFPEWLGKNPNHIYTMRDQLDAGVRLLELDIHDPLHYIDLFGVFGIDVPFLMHSNLIPSEISFLIDNKGQQPLKPVVENELATWVNGNPNEIIFLIVQNVKFYDDNDWISIFENAFGDKLRRATVSGEPNMDLVHPNDVWKSRRELLDDGIQVIFETLDTFERVFGTDNLDHIGKFAPKGEENLTQFELTYGDGLMEGGPMISKERLENVVENNVNIARMDFILGREGKHGFPHSVGTPWFIHRRYDAESDLPEFEYMPIPKVSKIPWLRDILVVGPSLYDLPAKHNQQRGDRLGAAVWSWRTDDPAPMREPNETFEDGRDVAVQSSITLPPPYRVSIPSSEWESASTASSEALPFALRSVHRYRSVPKDASDPSGVEILIEDDLRGNFRWKLSTDKSKSWSDFTSVELTEQLVVGEDPDGDGVYVEKTVECEYEFAGPVNGLQNEILFDARSGNATPVWLKAHDLDHDGVWSTATDFLYVFVDSSGNLVIQDLVQKRDAVTDELFGNDDDVTITIDVATGELVIHQANLDYPVVASVGTRVTSQTVRVPLSAFTGEVLVKMDLQTETGEDRVTVETGVTADTMTLRQDGLETVRLGVNALSFVVENAEDLVVDGQWGDDALAIDATTDPFAIPISYMGGNGADSVIATRDAHFALGDTQLTIGGVGSIALQSVEVASLTGGTSANWFTFAGWTGSATAAGLEGDDHYVFGLATGPGAYSIVELFGQGDDTVDFRYHGPDNPAQALDWLNPAGNVTATSLAAHPDVGSVSTGMPGQQESIEYGLNITPHLDPILGDKVGVRCEPIPYDVRFVDVGTKMTHTAVIDWGDGNSQPGVVREDPTTVEGLVEGLHAYTHLDTYQIDVTLTDHSPSWLWPPGAIWWENSAAVSALVAIVPAVVKNDPQRPGEQALFVGGSLDHDRIYVSQYRSGTVRVLMNRPVYRGYFRPSSDGHIYVFTCQGNDRIVLYANVDHDAEIYAGPGNDYLYGGRGNDKLDGHQGVDRLFGRLGDDQLVGGPGRDFLYGSSGNDTLSGPDAVDFYYRKIWGDAALDGDDRDWLYGHAGNDTLIGGSGRDYMYGYAGNDTLSGGSGSDLLYGHSGNDTLIGGSDRDYLYGHAGNDTLSGDSGSDLLYGHSGNDTLSGGSDSDYLYGHAGNDLLDGGTGRDRLVGYGGNDILLGGSHHDYLYGNSGRDLLIGGLGADRLWGSSGDDILIAGITDHDANYEALRAVMAAWTGSGSAAARIAYLQYDSPFILRSGVTVHDDGGARDTLFGGSGVDWFLYFYRDRAY